LDEVRQWVSRTDLCLNFHGLSPPQKGIKLSSKQLEKNGDICHTTRVNQKGVESCLYLGLTKEKQDRDHIF